MIQNTKKVAFHTLGCKLNFSETSTIVRMFNERGFETVDFEEKADVYVINTCSVTSMADKKCRQIIQKATKKSEEAFIAVIGCYSQLKPEEIAQIEGVDAVFGTRDKFKIFDLIDNLEKRNKPLIHSCDINQVDSFESSYNLSGRTRSFLKVQDGCDYKCTYCTIPLARGKSRNPSVKQLVEDTKQIAAKGFKEIILTGVNIGDFGRSTNESFFELIKNLEAVEGIERWRISSVEPNLLTNEIIEHVAKSKKIMPHFHIPLQSGNNEVLAKMRRRYRRELFADRVNFIKQLMPNAFIGVDVIVGFPGETADQFLDAYQFIESMDISFLHVFPYSERPNTPAAEIKEKVQSKEISRRTQLLIALSDKKHKQFYKNHLNTETTVLFESGSEKKNIFGFTNNYIKVQSVYNRDFINKIIPVRLCDIAENGNVIAECL